MVIACEDRLIAGGSNGSAVDPQIILLNHARSACDFFDMAVCFSDWICGIQDGEWMRLIDIPIGSTFSSDNEGW